MSLATLLVVLAAATASASPAKEPVLLDFHAEWCPPCRQMRPAVAQLKSEGYPVKSVDIDQAPDLAKKYGVEAVPTFIVVDPAGRELDRSSGSQPAAQLAKLYNEARTKARPPAGSRAHAQGDDEDGEEASADEDADAAAEGRRARTESEEVADRAATFKNPKPWETVVRIRVESKGSIGFGSGTIISSTPEESIILTCAHIFKLEGQRQQAPPDRFPRPIYVDLFDGKLHGEEPASVHFVERVKGKAIDYDFDLDVGLIRIRPGRRLPASRVVPAYWKPLARMGMITVGCSEGNDATAWSTVIVNPQMRGLSGHQAYEALECTRAPKQGRSGGGIYTSNGYIAGVCNFAEPRGDHGLYATPNSIYSILDRNNLMALYAPVGSRSGALLASRGGKSRAPANGEGAPVTIARAQSPDGQEEHRVPDPEQLKIKVPGSRRGGDGKQSATRVAWSPGDAAKAPIAKLAAPEPMDADAPQQAEINIDPAADSSRDGHVASEEPAQDSKVNTEDVPAPASKAPASAGGSKSGWRPSREVERASSAHPSN
ncbi:thioredoxin domain-containing protein [Aquisphaera insulae]|uniref:thioredoxin domain-containing protein n=1 Tax=Aquisphaera insulae TaxID=2712864 RepID=UPI0013EDFE1B|nr:thioredoxin domain-containing protein [Aquisphaera insulae]